MRTRHPTLGRIGFVILAHNEQHTISKAIASIRCLHGASFPIPIHILANGCTDGTEQVVHHLARMDPLLSLYTLPLGDKSNAWNAAIHDIGLELDWYVLMDADVACNPTCLLGLAEAVRRYPECEAIAGLPLSGRNRERYRALAIDLGWIFGNLYALRSSLVTRIRTFGLRLPVGLIGDDHFVSRFAHSDIGLSWEETPERVKVSEQFGYTFRSLSPVRYDDLSIYIRRKVTYALRQHQLDRVWNTPLNRLPASMLEVDRNIAEHLMSKPAYLRGFVDRAVLARLERRLAKYPMPAQ